MSMLFAATYPERTIALVLYGTVADFTVRDPDYKEDPACLPRADGGVVGQPRVRAGRDRGLGRARSRVRRAAGRVARVVHAEVGQSGRGGRPRAHEPRDQRHPCAPVDPRAHARDRQGRGPRLPDRPGARDGEPDRRRHARRAPGERALALGRRPGRDRGRGASASWSRSARSRRSSTGRWRPCCSPTSPGPPRRPPSSAIDGWKELVEEHHRRVRGQLARYRGVEVDTAGDGFFATFDGPARAVRCATRSSTRSRRSASRSERACTPARSRRSTARSAGWPW